MSISDIIIEKVALSQLMMSARNARVHPAKQITKLARSIRSFGFNTPLIIDEKSRIIAGHGRFEAAKKIGLQDVPCIRIKHLSDVQKRAYLLADNKLALDAGWDMEILAAELEELGSLDIDLMMTGFELPEIDQILLDRQDASPKPSAEEERIPPVQNDAVAVTQVGDQWILGRHRVRCGDAKDPAEVRVLMDGDLADAVFVDPPYNVPIVGHVSGKGRTKHRQFVEASGEMTEAAFIVFLTSALEAAEQHCRNGAIVYTCMDWRHLGELLAAGRTVFADLKNLCVWSKTNAGMGTFYRSQHELILVWKVGDAPHINNFGLGETGRHRTNVWNYAGVNSFGRDRTAELEMHPTVKPVALVADALRDVTHRGQVVLDTFGGSGTTLIAAERTGRTARLLELDPLYCDVIVRRWQALTGKRAVLASSGASFEQVEGSVEMPIMHNEMAA